MQEGVHDASNQYFVSNTFNAIQVSKPKIQHHDACKINNRVCSLPTLSQSIAIITNMLQH